MKRVQILELATIIGAVIILSYIAIISVPVLQFIDTSPDSSAPTITVVGKQWAWEFIYPDGTRSGEVVINHGEIVNLELISDDVIHSLYIRNLGFKLDTMPGRTNKSWLVVEEPGEYDIQCAEFCGLNHWAMRATLKVL